MLLTVPQAAERIQRNPETIRRWIRSGRLQAEKVGTQHVIEKEALDAAVQSEVLAGPPGWDTMFDGQAMPDVVAWLRADREGH